MKNRIDHFAIGAANLEQGVNMLREMLGVEIPRGGKHDMMSTHNCVAQAGNSSFLEIISIDPEAPAPNRTRWFSLDDPKTQSRLAVKAGPLCWVVGTDDLDGIVAASPVDLGEIVTFTRGDRSWRLTIPEDGSLPENALLPAFIEWSEGPHPSTGMQDPGIRLKQINLHHPDPEEFSGTLKVLQIDHLVNLIQRDESALSFTLQTPDGSEVIIS